MEHNTLLVGNITEYDAYTALAEIFRVSHHKYFAFSVVGFCIAAFDSSKQRSYCILPGEGEIYLEKFTSIDGQPILQHWRKDSTSRLGPSACIYSPAAAANNLHLIQSAERKLYLYSSNAHPPIEMPLELLNRIMNNIKGSVYEHPVF